MEYETIHRIGDAIADAADAYITAFDQWYQDARRDYSHAHWHAAYEAGLKLDTLIAHHDLLTRATDLRALRGR